MKGASAAAIRWVPPPGQPGSWRCRRCQRWVGDFPEAYGDGAVWCRRCALIVDEQRLESSPFPPALPTAAPAGAADSPEGRTA